MLSARSFAANLVELLRREQSSLADFLIAVAEFDRQQLWRRLGYASLFAFLRRELHLSKAAAFYRHKAVALVQRFPEVVAPLREGRLCLSAIVELAKVITVENRAEVLPRFFGLSKREARVLAAEISPHAAPPRRDVITSIATGTRSAGRAAPGEAMAAASSPPVTPGEPTDSRSIEEGAPASQRRRANPPEDEAVPLTASLARLHVTVSRRFIAKLDAARVALSHTHPAARMEELLEAALDALLERDAKRKGFVSKPQVKRRPSAPAHVPAAIKREVWQRDGGRCQWQLHSGEICGSRTRVQIDHIQPRALGGPSTTGNLRLLCAAHNQEAARRYFAEAFMDRFAPRSSDLESVVKCGP